MKVSGAAKGERREREGRRRAAKIVFILKAKWKEKLSTVNNCRGGEEGERRGGGGGPKGRGCWLIKGMWLAWDSVTGILR